MSDSEDQKERVRRAIENYCQREDARFKPKRKYNKPEKEFEKVVLEWCLVKGWSVHVYESKAKFNPKRGRYTSTALPFGHTDLAGVDPFGIGVYVELKDRDRRSDINRHGGRQRKFIEAKIEANAFACVIDRLEQLETLYNEYIKLRRAGTDTKKLLLDALPDWKLLNERD